MFISGRLKPNAPPAKEVTSTDPKPTKKHKIDKDEKIEKLKIVAKETVDIKGIGFYTLGRYRKNLNDRINHRLDSMLSSGWIEEVNDLIEYERKENSLFPALNTIGYGQIQSFLKNEISFEKMKENIFIKTRQFAKRQNQWFNRENTDLTIKMDDLKIDEIIQILCGIFKVMI